ncbi:DNA-binding protein [Mycetocola tolaasinivorans]|uniref:DNA-binding protein n=1 Tax=Mycetocola tolaasinivorans TaxID=76635 RepID=A0A3L7A133_9MICO|nr:DNA-binding protein [Mycetocola tolaasinivorans]
MTTKEVAEKLGVAVQTLINWRNLEKGPQAVKFGKMVRYNARVVEAFLVEWKPAA